MKFQNNNTLNIVLLLFSLAILQTSCMKLGINLKRKAPIHEGRYPDFGRKDSLRGQLTPLRTAYDVKHYALNLNVDIDNKFLKGSVDIYATFLKPTSRIQIDLFENMKINKIEHNNKNLKFEREHDAVFIEFSEEINGEKTEKISVFYEGNPTISKRPPWKSGMVWKRDKEKNDWVGVACEGDGASIWWPLKDHPYDEADSTAINISVPKGLFCVSNGLLRERKVSENNEKETFKWFVSYPINSYNVTLYIGNYEHFSLSYAKNDTVYPLQFYVLPYNKEKAKKHFEQTEDIIRYFETAFGEYPWWRDEYKMVESPYAGMEHQTAIAYGQGYKNTMGNNFDYIILHETAHEWWGNSITAKDMAHLWLHEGFATYSEALYVEHSESYDAYLDYINFYAIFIKNKRPIVGPEDVNYFNFKDGDIYTKGALTLHTLRSVINNDDLFKSILHDFAVEYRNKIVVTKDFTDFVNEKTETNYDWFFSQYLYDRKPPKFQYFLEYNNKSKENILHYRWADTKADFMMPIFVNIDDGKDFELQPTANFQQKKLDAFGKIKTNKLTHYFSVEKLKRLPK